jgi:hypothetical protein
MNALRCLPLVLLALSLYSSPQAAAAEDCYIKSTFVKCPTVGVVRRTPSSPVESVFCDGTDPAYREPNTKKAETGGVKKGTTTCSVSNSDDKGLDGKPCLNVYIPGVDCDKGEK